MSEALALQMPYCSGYSPSRFLDLLIMVFPIFLLLILALMSKRIMRHSFCGRNPLGYMCVRRYMPLW